MGLCVLSAAAGGDRGRRGRHGAGEVVRADAGGGAPAAAAANEAAGAVLPGPLLGPDGGDEVQVPRLLLELRQEPIQGGSQ